MHWILQSNLFNESAYQVLLDTLQRFDIPFSIHKVVPFVGELVPEPELNTKNVMCMGAYSLRHAAKKYGWTPGVFDLEEFDFTKQLAKWGNEMLNADSVVTRFEDANFPDGEDLMFMRPILDSKSFAGKVFERQEFYDWKRQVCVLEHDYGNSLDGSTIVQMCKPKVIYAEYRFWIVDGVVVSCSLYKRGNRVMYSSDVDDHVKRYAGNIARCGDITLSIRPRADLQPARAWVLDVCETPDGMRIVETNTLNSAGFYACDIPALVHALENTFSER